MCTYETVFLRADSSFKVLHVLSMRCAFVLSALGSVQFAARLLEAGGGKEEGQDAEFGNDGRWRRDSRERNDIHPQPFLRGATHERTDDECSES